MICDDKLTAARNALLDGDLLNAETFYTEILTEDPENWLALDGMGVLYCQIDDPKRGIEFFHEALLQLPPPNGKNVPTDDFSAEEITQSQATLHFHLGLAQRAVGNRAEAIAALKIAARLSPLDADPLINLAQLQFEAGGVKDAVDSFRKLTKLQPENASAWLTLGYVLTLLGKHGDSIRPLEEASRLDPASPDACFYLAESLRHVERYKDSLPYYQRMLQVAMEWPQAVVGYGKSLLALGYLEDGWDAMEFRLGCAFGSWERHALPNWDGTENDNQTILAYSEEGTAADLMFASCLPDLINRVGHVVVECDSSLHGLFKRSFPRATVVPLAQDTVAMGGNPWNLAFDNQIAFGSLPRFFRPNAEAFPQKKVYLLPDNDCVEKWTNRLAEVGGVAKVGVLWQGGWTAETEQQTALPMFELRNLMLRNQADAAWVCLQNGSKQKEIDLYRKQTTMQIRLYPEAFQYDLDEMAGLLSSLDLVLTPPGYVAHLAAALGVRTWVIAPAPADWRWTLGAKSSLWHPTARLFRQRMGQPWSDLFQDVHMELGRFLQSYIPPSEEEPIMLSFPEPQEKRLKIRRVA